MLLIDRTKYDQLVEHDIYEAFQTRPIWTTFFSQPNLAWGHLNGAYGISPTRRVEKLN